MGNPVATVATIPLAAPMWLLPRLLPDWARVRSLSGMYPNSQTLGCLHIGRLVHTCIYMCTENGHRAPTATEYVYTQAHMHCGIIVLMALLHDCISTGMDAHFFNDMCA